MISSTPLIRKWWFSIAVLITYLAAFDFWRLADAQWVKPSSVLISFLLALILALAAKAKYFLNLVDLSTHALVILDILLEGILLRAHSSRGFYWCALGFALVLAPYRFYLFARTKSRQPNVG